MHILVNLVKLEFVLVIATEAVPNNSGDVTVNNLDEKSWDEDDRIVAGHNVCNEVCDGAAEDTCKSKRNAEQKREGCHNADFGRVGNFEKLSAGVPEYKENQPANNSYEYILMNTLHKNSFLIFNINIFEGGCKNEKHFSERSALSRDRRGLNSQPPA